MINVRVRAERNLSSVVESNMSVQIDVVAGIIIKDGKVLLAQRAATASQGNLWEFPGGKIEDKESPEQALERELLEELSITTVTVSWVADSVFDYNDKTVCLKGYISHWVSGDLVLNEHQDVVWVKPDELQTYALCSADIPIVDRLLQVLAETSDK